MLDDAGCSMVGLDGADEEGKSRFQIKAMVLLNETSSIGIRDINPERVC